MKNKDVDTLVSHLIEEADRWELEIKAFAERGADNWGAEYFQCISNCTDRLRKIAQQVTPNNLELIRATYEVTNELASYSICLLKEDIASHRKEPRGISQKHEHAYELLWWMVFDHPEAITNENVSCFLERFLNHHCLAINPDDPNDGNYTVDLPARRETIKRSWIGTIRNEVGMAHMVLEATKGDITEAIAIARKMFDEQKRCAFLQKRKLIK